MFQSRKKWGLVYALATVAGLLCIIGNLGTGATAAILQADQLQLAFRILSLPASSFAIIVGMYVLNDVVDSDLDRANGKKRPIPAGIVSKKQALAFVCITNGIGILLAGLTMNLLSVTITVVIAVIGIMYSAPKISLKDRFVAKTLSIAITMMLCGILGTTMMFSFEASSGNWMVPTYLALMLGTMIFITSPFNDMGDILGDKAAGRRTIPIIIGRENTIKMAIVLAATMIGFSGLFYAARIVTLTTVVAVSLVASVAAINIFKVLKRLDDADYVRSKHKLSYPLHILLQSAIVIGVLLA